VGNGFSADYSHETSEPAYVGVVYGASAGGGGPGPAPALATAHVVSILGGHGKLTLVISCPAGAVSCTTARLTVSVVEHLKHGHLKALTAASKKTGATKTVVIASASIPLAAGARRTLSFKLNATGRALLARFGKLSAIVKVSSGSTLLSKSTIHILKPVAAKKKK
jgi:hypothetical protein